MDENVRQEEVEAPEEITSGIPAKNEFQRYLQNIFSEADGVDRIMHNLENCDYSM